MKNILLFVAVKLLLTACDTQRSGAGSGVSDDGMTARHQAEIPAEYKGLTNPIPSNDESLGRGAELYATNCISCHGDDGLGDGPAASALNPPPAPLAHTSQAMGDDYLFWRISEGGIPFNTSMPPWKVLDEQARWDLINYMRTLEPAAQTLP